MNKYTAILLFALILLAVSCDDVLEKNIGKKAVILRAPQDNDTIVTGIISFWWDSLEGAREYELQIVSPSMASPDILVTDTVITKTLLKVSLPEGKYEWCVKGVNTAYETEYSCRSLLITD